MPPDATFPEPRRLVLYDGVCGLCNRSVRFLLRRDRRRRLTFAPLQGPTAKAVLARHDVDDDLSTMVFVDDADGAEERVAVRSTGALEILAALGGVWRLTAAFKLVPPFARDAVYRWVARNRYGWFGRSDTCELPPPDFERRFLDEELLGTTAPPAANATDP